ncbi:type 1 glutamine amidotransferase domain-containing protein [Dactylosporangium matsuzakiense]|uniref:type 1 glutamine amidotransferase domain-containing protein n=1 Tax=Dactylosporangium matsuzakiense TaxID=53360 RepID=UPI0021C4C060|nr:type 1 glutamine amidotransferase domain-containing protein [Dactylosporangium matsuzakiense]UWZ48086.1 DJ-1/PfpI family protein [Dactylosporangium matsuzakiense]
MSKHVLCVVSEYGFWAQELLLPVDRLESAGIAVHFASPTGAQPTPDGGSLDSSYVDPPLGRPVTSKEMEERARSTDWETYFKDRQSLADLLPVRPYLSSGSYIAAMEEYYDKRQAAWDAIVPRYDALLLVGGSGPIVDMVNNPRVHDLVLGFHAAGKLIAAECYAVTCLAMARELDDRRPIIEGRHVTGHTMEYDYTSGWAVMANGAPLVFNAPPFSLEYILRDAVGPHGRFHGNVGRRLSVILDHPFLTSRSVGESDLCGQIMVEALTQDRREYGFARDHG